MTVSSTKVYFFTVLFLILLRVNAQVSPLKSSDSLWEADAPPPDIQAPVERVAKFPGGSVGLNQYLYDSLRYPPCEWKHGMSGLVQVAFTVEKDGTVSDPHANFTVSGAPGFEAEAIRLVMAMPRWSPATVMGEPVAMVQIINIVFTYTGTDSIATPGTCPCGPCDPYTDTNICLKPDSPARYSNGASMLQLMIRSRIRYPQTALINQRQGDVTVRCLIEKDGTVSRVLAVYGIKDAPELNTEAERVAKSLTGFQPAMRGGVPCRAWLDVVISFRLPK